MNRSLDLEKTPTNGNHNGLGAIVGPQFANQILNVEVHGVLRNKQFIGDLFVFVTIPNEPKDVQLACR
jgi:hypothetical protein